MTNKNKQGPKSVLSVITQMSTTTDEQQIIRYENLLSYMFAFPTLVVGAILNIFGMYYVGGASLSRVMTDSIFMLAIAGMFFFALKLIKNPTQQAHVFSVLFSVTFFYVLVRYYHVAGPALWSLIFILIMISMLHLRKSMLVLMSLTAIAATLYISIWRPTITITNDFYHTQIFVYTLTIIIAMSVHSIVQNRYKKILEQYRKVYQSEELIQRTFEAVGDGVITIDKDKIIQLVNPKARMIMGCQDEAKVEGQAIHEVMHLMNASSQQVLSGLIASVFDEVKAIEMLDGMTLMTPDRQRRSIEMTIAPILNQDASIEGGVLVFRDVTKKNEERKEIERLSYHDQLTGLYNRRYFEEELLRLDTERQMPLSVIYADVNGLKTYNDAFGHEKGDGVIIQAGHMMKSQCRKEDILARTGGDEFIVLLPQTSEAMARNIVERIELTMTESNFMNLRVSLSIGVATKVHHEESMRDTLQRAEDEMYQKKIYDSTSKRSLAIKSIVQALYQKSPEEERHAKVVGQLCGEIGRAYGLGVDKVKELMRAGELHDIGKIALDHNYYPVTPGSEDAYKNEIMKHPETSYRLLSTSAEYYRVAEYALSHHENWDGTGYPKGLKGDAISLESRIIAVANAYDGLTKHWQIHPHLTEESARDQLIKMAGRTLDPDLVDLFVHKVLGAEEDQ